MDRKRAIEYVSRVWDRDLTENWEDSQCLMRLRHKNTFLPEYGTNGIYRDDAEWVYIDMAEKVDTGEYGCVYYIPDYDRVRVRKLADEIGINELYAIVREIREE